ncbi:hypothetical protein YC2023_024868 [Brassica napus]
MSLVDQILGEGAVADLSVWENKITSGITLVMATLIWFLFEIKETEPVPFLCSILLLLILLLFIWVKRPPTPEELQQEDSPVRALFSEIEGLLLMLYEIAYGEDIKTFIWRDQMVEPVSDGQHWYGSAKTIDKEGYMSISEAIHVGQLNQPIKNNYFATSYQFKSKCIKTGFFMWVYNIKDWPRSSPPLK